ncbi:VWA domain-containing protein, partial [Micrococcus endophyticus]
GRPGPPAARRRHGPLRLHAQRRRGRLRHHPRGRRQGRHEGPHPGRPRGAELGLVTFGHRRAEDCTDIETIQPVGPVDKAALTAQVDALGARGETPISAALQQAADALEEKEKGTIVLVSDGQPSCDTPPACEDAAQLTEHLTTRTTRALHGYEAAGTPITGGSSLAE